MNKPTFPREPENPSEHEDPPSSRILHDHYLEPHLVGLADMNQREEEQIFLMYATRKQRKAIKARRKAREQAKKQGDQNDRADESADAHRSTYRPR
jgi:hypothetical protein